MTANGEGVGVVAFAGRWSGKTELFNIPADYIPYFRERKDCEVIPLVTESALIEMQKQRAYYYDRHTALLARIGELADDCIDSSRYGGYSIDERKVYIDISVKLRTLASKDDPT